MSIRTQRIGEQIRGEIARLLREETSDPRIGLLTITRVKVSPDLSDALVFWSPLDVSGEADVGVVEDGLLSASGFVRRQIARNLNLRRTPALHFKHDPSVEEGSRTLATIRSLVSEQPDMAGSHADEGGGPNPSTPEREEEEDGEKA